MARRVPPLTSGMASALIADLIWLTSTDRITGEFLSISPGIGRTTEMVWRIADLPAAAIKTAHNDNSDPHNWRDVRQGVRRTDRAAVFSRDARTRDAPARPKPRRRANRDRHDGRQPRSRRAGPNADRRPMPRGDRKSDRHHPRDGHDGGHRTGPGGNA